MVRKGLLAFFVVGMMACSQEVDDPADFTAGNSQGDAATSSSGGTGGPGNSSGVADNDGGGTTTTGVDGTTTAPPPPETTSGPSTDSGGGGNGNCGNGAIDAGEQCDGADLQGFDCASLGLSGGTLACDPVMCTFDTSMCSAGPGTSG